MDKTLAERLEVMARRREAVRDGLGIPVHDYVGQSDIDDLREAARAVREAVPGWLPIETAPSGVEVLVHYTNRLGKHRIVKARHVVRYTEESTTDTEDGVDEYDEANDRYTYREGWWECIDNWDDFGFIVINEGSPDAWQPLPAAPTQDQENGS